ncbi:MAG: DUF1326 domain-containing protein [Treponema sp.]|nr:DUF1326 domain-containing protein [Treponema sp.]
MATQTNQKCSCSYPCPRHGDCRACQEYHRKTGSRTNCGKDGYGKDSPKAK